MIFGTAVVNSYLIYKKNYAASDMSLLQFRESLVRSLLLGTSFEKLKPGLRQQSASRSKRKLADHKLEDAVLAATRKLGNNNQEKQAWPQQRK